MNSVQLVGNLTRDPEGGTTQSGVNYCRFTVACQRRFKNANGTYDADFISCVAWRQTADFIQRYFRKGSRIGLIGTIQTGSYTAQDGSKHYTTDVIADNVEFVGSRSDGGNGGSAPPPAPSAPQRDEQQRMDMNDFTEVDDDDLPF